MIHKIALPAIEHRFITAVPELRSASDSGIAMQGYAAKFNSISGDLGYFREKIAPGAFSTTIVDDDIVLNINHDNSRILARTANKTLRLSEDTTGLLVEAEMANTTYAQDLAVLMKRGDMNKMSFAFGTLRDYWEETPDGTLLRTVLEAKLYDVSVVTVPAYDSTEAGLRSLDPLGLAKLDPEQRKQVIKSIVAGGQPDDIDLLRRRLSLKYKNI